MKVLRTLEILFVLALWSHKRDYKPQVWSRRDVGLLFSYFFVRESARHGTTRRDAKGEWETTDDGNCYARALYSDVEANIAKTQQRWWANRENAELKSRFPPSDSIQSKVHLQKEKGKTVNIFGTIIFVTFINIIYILLLKILFSSFSLRKKSSLLPNISFRNCRKLYIFVCTNHN